MSKGFNYSKWDNIELSDDEDDVHPNIDRESWFRMKHRSRVEREDNEDKDKNRIIQEVGCACVCLCVLVFVYLLLLSVSCVCQYNWKGGNGCLVSAG
jgi:hypothetical protein